MPAPELIDSLARVARERTPLGNPGITYARLRCPDCRGQFEFRPSTAHPPAYLTSEFGILSCDCFRYPVVDGIPILLKGRVGVFAFWGGEVEEPGPSVQDIVALIDAGEFHEALLRCLTFAPRIAWVDRLPGWSLWHGERVRRWTSRLVRQRIERMLRSGSDTAEDWFGLFYGRLTTTDPYFLWYYRNRFALPRTLATLTLIERLPGDERPVLDLASGFGPFAHYLTKRDKAPLRVLGLDFNFYMLWGQKRCVAPAASFVCADASRRLPFEDGAFSAALCSDALGWIHDKPIVASELRRCAPGRPVILARVGNGSASPSYREELTPEAYRDLFAHGSPRFFSEQDLVRHYLARSDPFAAPPTEPRFLGKDRWLYFVLEGHGLMSGTMPVDKWPHAVGKLELNPVYRVGQPAPGRLALRFEFPAVWIAYQNADMHAYHADRFEIDAAVLERARRGERDGEIERLVRSFVLIGMPERYLRPRIGEGAPMNASPGSRAA